MNTTILFHAHVVAYGEIHASIIRAPALRHIAVISASAKMIIFTRRHIWSVEMEYAGHEHATATDNIGTPGEFATEWRLHLITPPSFFTPPRYTVTEQPVLAVTRQR